MISARWTSCKVEIGFIYYLLCGCVAGGLNPKVKGSSVSVLHFAGNGMWGRGENCFEYNLVLLQFTELPHRGDILRNSKCSTFKES